MKIIIVVNVSQGDRFMLLIAARQYTVTQYFSTDPPTENLYVHNHNFLETC